MKTCAVIISAYQATRWIEECLDSVMRQRPLTDWRYELRIGVDGCPETSEMLRRMRMPHFYSIENVGPYLVRNTLMAEPADAYAVFDADDVMRDRYLKTLIHAAGLYGIAGGARRKIDEDGKFIDPNVFRFCQGVCVITPFALSKLGGYRAWRIAADSDLIARANAIGIPVVAVDKALYHRRDHPTSLTKAEATKIKSAARQHLWRESKIRIRLGQLYVEPKTVAVERVEMDAGFLSWTPQALYRRKRTA